MNKIILLLHKKKLLYYVGKNNQTPFFNFEAIKFTSHSNELGKAEINFWWQPTTLNKIISEIPSKLKSCRRQIPKERMYNINLFISSLTKLY